MLGARPDAKRSPKTLKKRTMLSVNQDRLYLDKSIFNEYFNKYKAICVSEPCKKQQHKDSNVDLESSSTSIPSLTEAESKRTSVAINTEEGRGPSFAQSLQYHRLSEARYFMFPAYGVYEQSVQTTEEAAARQPAPPQGKRIKSASWRREGRDRPGTCGGQRSRSEVAGTRRIGSPD